jgi:hypothetical protein
MTRPRPKPVAPIGSKPYVGEPAPNVEVVPFEPYTGEKVPPPGTPPRPAAAREITFTDLVRKATEAYYGNACYYHRVLRANGFSGLEVFVDGDEVVMPARAKAASLAEAERWRATLAETA